MTVNKPLSSVLCFRLLIVDRVKEIRGCDLYGGWGGCCFSFLNGEIAILLTEAFWYTPY